MAYLRLAGIGISPGEGWGIYILQVIHVTLPRPAWQQYSLPWAAALLAFLPQDR